MIVLKNLNHAYFSLFNWCLSPLKAMDPVHRFRVHALFVATITTGILMWAYAFTAYAYLNDPLISYMGFIYAIVHLLTPILYKYTHSIEKAIYCMLIPGGIFQVHFAILSGGFHTSMLIWISILPVIAGLLTNKKHTFIWIIIVLTAAIGIFTMDYFLDCFTVNLLDSKGRVVTQALTTFGMITLNSCFTIFLLNLKDISEARIRNRALSNQNLLRVLAHDVSTPLSLILNNTLLLKKLVSKNKESKEEINCDVLESKIDLTFKYSEKIYNLIDAVREMEAFDSGKKSLNLKVICLKSCVDESISMLQTETAKKNITFQSKLSDTKILGIKSIIEHQIISNILSNTIKFSPKDGHISIHEELSESEATLVIKDNGIGIPKYMLHKIFDPLAKTNRPGTEGETGTGFGMPIAKRSIQLLGGSISVDSLDQESHPDLHGSVFRLSFKRSKDEEC